MAYELPALPEAELLAPLGDDAFDAFRAIFDQYISTRDELALAHPTDESYRRYAVTDDQVRRAFELVRGATGAGYEVCREQRLLLHYSIIETAQDAIDSFTALPDVRPVHLLRFLIVTGALSVLERDRELSTWSGVPTLFIHYARSHGAPVSARELGHALDILGIAPDVLIWRRLMYGRMPLIGRDPQEWQFFVEHIDAIEAALGSRKLPVDTYAQMRGDIRENALKILAEFPFPPESLIPCLWDIALGSAKKHRELAMKCLSPESGKGEMLAKALLAKKTATRSAAAGWIAKLGLHEAVPSLRQAMQAEKDDAARSAMADALRELTMLPPGVCGKDELTTLAASAVEAGIPDDLAWFPFHALPAVRWAGTDEPVPSDVLRWLVIQQYKHGSPEPSAILLEQASLLDTDDAKRLGQFVLEAWVMKDMLRKYTQEEALDLARARASQLARYYPNVSNEKLVEMAFNGYANELRGSAIRERGILSVTAACGAVAVAPLVDAYLKRWYGYRATQCKSLLQVASWLDDKACTQVLLAVATRFRTRGIQDEAMACVTALAHRRGWSVDELADRTVPTAGFDAERQMVLSYGSRAFTVRLDSPTTFQISDSTGKIISALPEPRKDDDAALAKESKQALSSAKKELKSILANQKQRLYEAMCSQRQWTYGEWRQYLLEHPVAGYLCRSLIWATASSPSATIFFRPLDDGTLTDAHDSLVSLADDAVMRLAHRLDMDDADADAWARHFRDYEADHALDQVQKPAYRVSDATRALTEIRDFEGHMVDPRKALRKAEGMGYVRSAVEDGAVFSSMVKRFPSLGIEAEIETSGIVVIASEQGGPVALRSLCFHPISNETRPGLLSPNKLPLGQLPPVLLSECWNDLRLIAETGPGFDPDWEKKVR